MNENKLMYMGSNNYGEILQSIAGSLGLQYEKFDIAENVWHDARLIIIENDSDLLVNMDTFTQNGLRLYLVLPPSDKSINHDSVLKQLSKFQIVDVIFNPISEEYLNFKIMQMLNQCIYRKFLDEMNIMAVIANEESKVVYVNEAFSDETGYGNEVMGEKTNLLKSGQHSLMFYNNLKYTLQAGVKWEGRFKNKRKNGTIFTEEAEIFPLQVGNKKFYCKTAVNITSHEMLMTEKEQSIQLSSAIQKSLIAEDIYDEKVIIHSKYKPLENVSGDIYSLYKPEHDIYCVFLADVVGHGVGSALLSTSIIAVANDLVSRNYMPDIFLENLNSKIMQLFKSKDLAETTYFTVAYVVLDLKKNLVHYANCGHPAIYSLFKDEVSKLSKANFAIGMFQNVHFEYESKQISKGMKMLIYTDGLVEIKGNSSEGEQILKSEMIQYSTQSDTSNMIDYLTSRIIEPSEDEINDDITMIVVDIVDR